MFELVFAVQRNASTYLPTQFCRPDRQPVSNMKESTLQGPPIISELVGR